MVDAEKWQDDWSMGWSTDGSPADRLVFVCWWFFLLLPLETREILQQRLVTGHSFRMWTTPWSCWVSTHFWDTHGLWKHLLALEQEYCTGRIRGVSPVPNSQEIRCDQTISISVHCFGRYDPHLWAKTVFFLRKRMLVLDGNPHNYSPISVWNIIETASYLAIKKVYEPQSTMISVLLALFWLLGIQNQLIVIAVRSYLP